MAEYIDRVKCWDDFYSGILDVLSDDDTNDRANEIMDIFDELPTADVEPVRHGHWVTDDGYPSNGTYAAEMDVHCSECGFDAWVSTGQYGWDYGDVFPYKYCPGCGAKMDGKDGDKNARNQLEALPLLRRGGRT